MRFILYKTNRTLEVEKQVYYMLGTLISILLKTHYLHLNS
ncbi:hypothetical protein HMPREF9953_0031 [Haemophilus parainfluenzae ATCC 33392]|nr:hypothetical protein HMPREF9953_0031 [Haemophilus parainfluenzae ATCC 33392]